jgi:hypothetical protein
VAVPLVIGAGLLGGYAFGPARPPLHFDVGRAEVVAHAPAPVRGSGGVTCVTVDTGKELQLSGGMRLGVLAVDPAIPTGVDQRAFVSILVTVGDRWRQGTVDRSDDVDLLLVVGRVADGSGEQRLAASDSSLLEIDWTNERGVLRFDRLVDAETGTPVSGPLGSIAGSLEWICGEAALPAGARAFAAEACAGASYPACQEAVILAIAESPGAEVAICESPGGTQVVPAAEVAISEACVGGETETGKVLRVVRLPE